MSAVAFPSFELFHAEEHDGWQTLSSEAVFADPHVQIERVRVLTPSRGELPVSWTVVQRKAAVAIAPMLADGRFVLIRQERVPVRQAMWEFPAGQIDLPLAEVTCQAAYDTVLNELREEAGAELAEGGSIQPLGHFFPSQGFTPECLYLFLARPVKLSTPPAPVGGESIDQLRCVTAAELREMVLGNELANGLSLALFAKLSALGLA